MKRYRVYLINVFDDSILQTQYVDADTMKEAISEAVRKFRWPRPAVHAERAYFS